MLPRNVEETLHAIGIIVEIIGVFLTASRFTRIVWWQIPLVFVSALWRGKPGQAAAFLAEWNEERFLSLLQGITLVLLGLLLQLAAVSWSALLSLLPNTELFSDPEFWVLLAVAIFVVVVWKPMRRAIVGGIDARVERIRQELEAARNLRDEAQQALAAYQRQQQQGAAEAQAIIAHAKEEAERIAAQSLRDLEETLRRRQQLAQERIAQEEAKAVAEIRAIAVEVAISASRQVIAASLDERRGAALIDDAIAALPRQLH
jgi:F-type H+-transporting ATPase subunit b